MSYSSLTARFREKNKSVPKILLLGLGWICVVLGGIGVFLPVIPTTPFLLVSAWAFTKSSPRFRNWLENHRLLGPYIQDWHEYHAIPLKAKMLAVAMISVSMTWLLVWSNLPVGVVAVVALCLIGAAAFILTRRTMHKDRTR